VLFRDEDRVWAADLASDHAGPSAVHFHCPRRGMEADPVVGHRIARPVATSQSVSSLSNSASGGDVTVDRFQSSNGNTRTYAGKIASGAKYLAGMLKCYGDASRTRWWAVVEGH